MTPRSPADFWSFVGRGDFDFDPLAEFEGRRFEHGNFDQEDPRIGGTAGIFRPESPADDDIGDLLDSAPPGHLREALGGDLDSGAQGHAADIEFINLGLDPYSLQIGHGDDARGCIDGFTGVRETSGDHAIDWRGDARLGDEYLEAALLSDRRSAASACDIKASLLALELDQAGGASGQELLGTFDVLIEEADIGIRFVDPPGPRRATRRRSSDCNSTRRSPRCTTDNSCTGKRMIFPASSVAITTSAPG